MRFAEDVVVVVMRRETHRAADELLIEKKAPAFADGVARYVATRNETDIGGCGRKHATGFGHDHDDRIAVRGHARIGAGQLCHRAGGCESAPANGAMNLYLVIILSQTNEAGEYFQSTGPSRFRTAGNAAGGDIADTLPKQFYQFADSSRSGGRGATLTPSSTSSIASFTEASP